MDLKSKRELLEQLITISMNAAEYAKENLFEDRAVEEELDRDTKVVADKEIESFILKKIKDVSDFNILSEESGLFIHNDDIEYRWIIDPLDGSLNFSRSIPLFCISIALWKGMEPVLGVIYDVNRNEIFSGIVGEGAWLNSQQISVSDIDLKRNAILCTGFPSKSDFSDENLTPFIKDVQDFKKVRLLGTAALSLAYVASGRADYYKESNIAIWDVAAGLAITKAAGGVVSYEKGTKENRFVVDASNSMLLKK